MPQQPNNVTIRKDLAEYAFAIMQDAKKIRDLINLFAPTVPTGVTTGSYNTFHKLSSFLAYANARRALGSQSKTIGLLSDQANFAAKPFGLRIPIDEHERLQAGGQQTAVTLLEQSKTRTLTVTCLLSHLYDIVTLIKTNVAPQAGFGNWLDPAIDPIHEINALIMKVWRQSGMVPSDLTIDFGAWAILCDNPNVKTRMGIGDVVDVTVAKVQALLISPSTKLTIVDTSVATGGGLGNDNATLQGILGGTVLAFYNSAMATPYDPSFCKNFSPSMALFTEVFTYGELPHVEWFENNWTTDTEIVSSLLVARGDVQGANG